MKPTIRKIKDIRGRKVLGYEASLGSIVSARCDSAARAIEDCEYLTGKAIERLAAGPTIGRWRNHTIVVYPTIIGWAYWIDTFSNGYGTDCGRDDKIAAYNSAVYHLAQVDWSADVDDYELIQAVPDVRLRAELAGWIGFQRSYIEIKAAGQITGENDIHRAACDAGHVYAREHFASYLHSARMEQRA